MTIPLFEPGGRWTFRQRAGTISTPKGEVSQRYASTAWDNVIGKVVPMTYEGAPFGHGQLVAAKVIEGGSAVDLTFEMVTEGGG